MTKKPVRKPKMNANVLAIGGVILMVLLAVLAVKLFPRREEPEAGLPEGFEVIESGVPTEAPEAEPTEVPEAEPTEVPEAEPTEVPEAESTEAEPTEVPEAEPTEVPEAEPTEVPEAEPTEVPEAEPTEVPEAEPTEVPEAEPTEVPEEEPTEVPEAEPTEVPEAEPTEVPEAEPTAAPVNLTDPDQAYLVVTAGGVVYEPIPLTGHQVFGLRRGEMINIIEVTENSICMAESTCENQDCVLQGTVTLENRKTRVLQNMILCLPNDVGLELCTFAELQERMPEWAEAQLQ